MDQSIGGFGDEPGIKVQLMNLIRSVRTVMRGVCPLFTHLHTHTDSHKQPPLKLFLVLSPSSAADCGEFGLHCASAVVWMKRRRVKKMGQTIFVTSGTFLHKHIFVSDTHFAASLTQNVDNVAF